MLKKILQPQALPHTPPVFLWVTHAAADKPLLFPSSGRQPSAVTASRGEQAALLSAGVSLSHWAVHVSARRLFVFVRKVWLHFFPKGFENSKCMLVLFIHNLLPSRTYQSVHLPYTTTPFPTSCFMCLLFPDTSLILVASQSHDDRGGGFVLLDSVCVYMFWISLGRRKGLRFLTSEKDRCQFCDWCNKYF